MLVLGSELLSVVDSAVSNHFPFFYGKPKQVGVGRDTLPDFLRNKLTLLRYKNSVINATDDAGALYLANEFLATGYRWLKRDCDPQNYTEADPKQPRTADTAKEFARLRNSLFDAISAPKQIDVQAAAAAKAPEDLLDLQALMTERCGDQANLFFAAATIETARPGRNCRSLLPRPRSSSAVTIIF